MRLVDRGVETVDPLSRYDVERCGLRVGVVVCQRRGFGVVVVGVVEADVEPEWRRVSHRDVVQSLVSRGLGAGIDVCAVRYRQAAAVGCKCGRICCAQTAALIGRVVECRAHLMVPPLSRYRLVLADVVLLLPYRMQGVHVETVQLLAARGRICDVGRPLG